VKSFYGFVFNPNEGKLLDEAKFKISKEYYPPGKRKPKKRRSVAQKQIKEFIKLGVETSIIADVMIYNVEVAMAFNEEHPASQEAFYKSILKSFQEAVTFLDANGISRDFAGRIEQIIDHVYEQKWINKSGFEDAMDNRGSRA
jgi:transcriptional regulator with PAS, ATPase and Fis domain